ncbi:polynucleotide kinase 3 phosphatase-domain-containing protein [Mycena floridula]|nr:polynucleotide kinase 3 phosphatase-domain-containing protein [Mycena floridula]
MKRSLDSDTAGSSSKPTKSAKILESDAPESFSKPTKPTKMHPFFKKEPSTLKWHKPFGGTCLYAVNLSPQSRVKVAAFDLDGTLIEGGFRPKGKEREWKWLLPCVKSRLEKLHNEGFSIVIVSNQAGLKSDSRLTDWKEGKMTSIAKDLPLPFHLFASRSKDKYRKPDTGIWDELVRIFDKDGVAIDREASFFVGDAAGRKGDHADSDLGWAEKVGLRFFTPEQFFKEKD